MRFHATDAELRAWAENAMDDTAVWSVDAHLEGCANCRSRVDVPLPDPPADLPPQGRVRRATPARRIGILILSGPEARLAWFAALAVTVLITTLVAALPDGTVPHWLLLMIAPTLPVLGTAASYGPRTDPLDELIGSTAYSGLRIILWRTLSVLAVSLPVAAVAGLASGLGNPAVWLLPSCALTALTLALASVTGPAVAAAAVGAGWFVLIGGALWSPQSGAELVTAQAGPVWLTLTVAAALALTHHHTRREARR